MARFAIYDEDRGCWLRLALLPTDDPRVIVTKWTDDPARAWRYPSLRAARRVLALVRERGLSVRNEAGERIY